VISGAVIEGIGGGPMTMAVDGNGQVEDEITITIEDMAIPAKFVAGQVIAEIWLNRAMYRKLCCGINFRVTVNELLFVFAFAASEAAEMTVKDDRGLIVAKIYVDEQLPPEAVIPESLKGSFLIE